MAQLNFHSQNTFPLTPPRLLPVLEKSKTTYKQWMEIHRNIERTARFGIGNRVDTLFLDLLGLLRKAAYTQINKKLVLLEKGLDKIDSLRFFLQLLWEAKLIPTKQYIALGADIENAGKIVGGWKKGLINKTSAMGTEERKTVAG